MPPPIMAEGPAPTSIAIVRLSALGDIVHTLPALQALRLHFPQTRITWWSAPAGAKLLALFEGIDEVALFERRRGWGQAVRTLRRRRGQWEWVLDFQGLLQSALVARLLGSRVAGFAPGDVRERPAHWFYSHTPPPCPPDLHVIHKNLHLLQVLGITTAAPQFPALRTQCQLPSPLLARQDSAHPPILLNVGAGWPTKQLTPQQWISVAKGLAARAPLWILWGNDTERTLAQQVSQESGARLAPQLAFAELIAALRHAALLISGDTLLLHLADLVQTPSVGLFGPTNPARNGSLLPQSRAISANPCGTWCYKRACDTIDCMRRLDPPQIVDAAIAIHASLS